MEPNTNPSHTPPNQNEAQISSGLSAKHYLILIWVCVCVCVCVGLGVVLGSMIT